MNQLKILTKIIKEIWYILCYFIFILSYRTYYKYGFSYNLYTSSQYKYNPNGFCICKIYHHGQTTLLGFCLLFILVIFFTFSLLKIYYGSRAGRQTLLLFTSVDLREFSLTWFSLTYNFSTFGNIVYISTMPHHTNKCDVIQRSMMPYQWINAKFMNIMIW